MSKHKKFIEMFSAYLDGELSSEKQQAVIDHLEQCASCRKEFNALQRLERSLQSWQDQELSLDLEQMIEKNYMQKSKKEVAQMKRPKKLFVGVTSGALATLLVCGVVFYVQDYVKRSMQGRIQDAAGGPYVPSQTAANGARAELRPFTYSRNVMANYNANAVDGMTVDVFRGGVPTTMAYRKLQSIGDAGTVIFGSGAAPASGYKAITVVPETDESYSLRQEQFNTESYERIYENRFLEAIDTPLSTFSIDVDTASYANVRRFVTAGQLPPADAVRIEEMINYFSYDYPQPEADAPFSITTEVAACPWNAGHDILLIGLKGREIPQGKLPPSNLVFLVDVSGSMNQPNKLPLVKNALKMLTQKLNPQDRVAMVVYAGAAGVVLDSTPGSNKAAILEALEWLSAGGSTAGGAGIRRAYQIAEANFIKGGNNRVILATDGDFNTGVSSDAEMVRLIEQEREKGVFLTVLGFGIGNYKDAKLEKIADKGNGNYYYIDTIQEAQKVFDRDLIANLFTIAKDVKIQIEFNPAQIKAYRLIGYENRMLAKEDFNDDTKDAGELGAGHSVTALYEIVYADAAETYASVDPLEYQKVTIKGASDLLTVKLRYKEPDGESSKLITQKVSRATRTNQPSNNFQFATAVAECGLLLRDSEYKAHASFDSVIKRARQAKGDDPFEYRAGFVQLAETIKLLSEIPGNAH